jgi:cation transport ATPase
MRSATKAHDGCSTPRSPCGGEHWFGRQTNKKMALVAVAITSAYSLYSRAVMFCLTGKVFFWELATLVDIMLLGHWIEMKSVMGASKVLDELAKLMPSDGLRCAIVP